MNQKPSPSSNLTPEQLTALANKVPDYLKITSELAKEIKEEQEKLREKFAHKFSKPSDDEVALRLAAEYEKAARLFFSDVVNGAPATEEELSFNRRRLAQALQTQGRYEEALEVLDAEVSSEAALITELVQEFHALIIPDDEFCSCVSPDGFPTTHTLKKIRNQQGEFVPVIRCTNCGHVNATKHVPESLSHLEKFRAGKTKAPDSELLKRQ